MTVCHDRNILVPTMPLSFQQVMLPIISGIIVMPSLIAESNTASACEVLSLPPVQEAYDNSAAVFSGKVTEFERVAMEGAGDRRMAVFAVDRYWKIPDGKDFKQMVVITEKDHGACGYDFELDKQYLVYASAWAYDNSLLSTSIGTRTQPLESARQDDLTILGEGLVPTVEVSREELVANTALGQLPTHEEVQIEGGASPLSLIRLIYPIAIGAAVVAAIMALVTLRRKRK